MHTSIADKKRPILKMP